MRKRREVVDLHPQGRAGEVFPPWSRGRDTQTQEPVTVASTWLLGDICHTNFHPLTVS